MPCDECAGHDARAKDLQVQVEELQEQLIAQRNETFSYQKEIAKQARNIDHLMGRCDRSAVDRKYWERMANTSLSEAARLQEVIDGA